LITLWRQTRVIVSLILISYLVLVPVRWQVLLACLRNGFW
jgi:hypothetical protein